MMGHAWVDVRLLLVSLLLSFPGLVVLRAFFIVFSAVLASIVDSLLSSEGSNYQVILYFQFLSLPCKAQFVLRLNFAGSQLLSLMVCLKSFHR